MTIGPTIRRLRKARRESLEQFGALTGLSESAVCDVEAGRRNLTLRTLALIAQGLGLRPSELLRLAENENQTTK